MYSNNYLTNISRTGKIVLCLAFISILFIVGCNKSVVTDPVATNTTVAPNANSQPNQAVAATPPQPGGTPATATTTATLPATAITPPPGTTGAVPAGQAATSPSPGPKQVSSGGFGNSQMDPNYSFGIKPTPTPTPAPTPKIEMVNGKIKQQWEAPEETKADKNPLQVTPDIVKQGRELYMQRCEYCHGKEGKGNGPFNNPKWKQSPNLTSAVVQANTDGELYYKVTTNRDRHPASKVRFTDEERWMIVAFLRTLK